MIKPNHANQLTKKLDHPITGVIGCGLEKKTICEICAFHVKLAGMTFLLHRIFRPSPMMFVSRRWSPTASLRGVIDIASLWDCSNTVSRGNTVSLGGVNSPLSLLSHFICLFPLFFLNICPELRESLSKESNLPE